MCGRFTLGVEETTLLEHVNSSYAIDALPQDFSLPRYNIAPAQKTLGIIQDAKSFKATAFIWGMQSVKHSKRIINARKETIQDRPLFKHSFNNQRCIILADGFYEWDQTTKIPYYFKHEPKHIFAFAGIYHKDPQGHLAMSILTKPANKIMATYHHRMPVILDNESINDWLNPSTPLSALFKILDTDKENLVSYPVSKAVNSTRHDHKSLLDQLEQQTLFDG